MIGRNRSPLCPVEALLKFLHFRGSRDGPLFVFQDVSPLTREKLNFTCLCFAICRVISQAIVSALVLRLPLLMLEYRTIGLKR